MTTVRQPNYQIIEFTVQYTELYSIVHQSNVQCIMIFYNTISYSEIIKIRYNTLKYSTIYYCKQIVLSVYNLVQYSTLLYSTVQSIVQYNTVNYSTVQYSKLRCPNHTSLYYIVRPFRKYREILLSTSKIHSLYLEPP